MSESSVSIDTKGIRGQFSIREFMVDFFGALMPGVLFVIVLIICLLFPLFFGIWKLMRCIGFYLNIGSFFNKNGDFIFTLSSLEVVVFFLIFLLVGYVVGTIFYRKDPKEPDYWSFIKIASKFSREDELKNWVLKIRKKTKAEIEEKFKKLNLRERIKYRKKKNELLNASPEKIEDLKTSGNDENNNSIYWYDPKYIHLLTVHRNEIQFPYNNLSGYLRARGRDDLVDKIPWDLDDDKVFNILKKKLNESLNEGKENENRIFLSEEILPRSKTFINTLKIRLQFFFPEKCGTINKNEAHIRLSTSLWHASSALKRFNRIGIIVTLVSAALVVGLIKFGLSKGDCDIANVIPFAVPFILNIGIFYLVESIKSNSEVFLHYQRVREIYYVLETAAIASKNAMLLFYEKGEKAKVSIENLFFDGVKEEKNNISTHD